MILQSVERQLGGRTTCLFRCDPLQIAATLTSFAKNGQAVSIAMLKANRMDLVLSPDELEDINQLVPIVQLFADVCDASGVQTVPTIDKYGVLLQALAGAVVAQDDDKPGTKAFRKVLGKSFATVWYLFLNVALLVLALGIHHVRGEGWRFPCMCRGSPT